MGTKNYVQQLQARREKQQHWRDVQKTIDDAMKENKTSRNTLKKLKTKYSVERKPTVSAFYPTKQFGQVMKSQNLERHRAVTPIYDEILPSYNEILRQDFPQQTSRTLKTTNEQRQKDQEEMMEIYRKKIEDRQNYKKIIGLPVIQPRIVNSKSQQTIYQELKYEQNYKKLQQQFDQKPSIQFSQLAKHEQNAILSQETDQLIKSQLAFSNNYLNTHLSKFQKAEQKGMQIFHQFQEQSQVLSQKLRMNRMEILELWEDDNYKMANQGRYNLKNIGDQVHFCFLQDIRKIGQKFKAMGVIKRIAVDLHMRIASVIHLQQKNGRVCIFVSDKIPKPDEKNCVIQIDGSLGDTKTSFLPNDDCEEEHDHNEKLMAKFLKRYDENEEDDVELCANNRKVFLTIEAQTKNCRGQIACFSEKQNKRKVQKRRRSVFNSHLSLIEDVQSEVSVKNTPVKLEKKSESKNFLDIGKTQLENNLIENIIIPTKTPEPTFIQRNRNLNLNSERKQYFNQIQSQRRSQAELKRQQQSQSLLKMKVITQHKTQIRLKIKEQILSQIEQRRNDFKFILNWVKIITAHQIVNKVNYNLKFKTQLRHYELMGKFKSRLIQKIFRQYLQNKLAKSDKKLESKYRVELALYYKIVSSFTLICGWNPYRGFKYTPIENKAHQLLGKFLQKSLTNLLFKNLVTRKYETILIIQMKFNQQKRRRMKKSRILQSLWQQIIQNRHVKPVDIPQYLQLKYIGLYITYQEKRYTQLSADYRQKISQFENQKLVTIARTIDTLTKQSIFNRDEQIELHMVKILAQQNKKRLSVKPCIDNFYSPLIDIVQDIKFHGIYPPNPEYIPTLEEFITYIKEAHQEYI